MSASGPPSRDWPEYCAIAVALGAAAIAFPAHSAHLSDGPSKFEIAIGQTVLPVSAYQPTACPPRAIILVFAGKNRNSDTCLHDAIPLVDNTCSIVLAPKFSQKKFPNWQYQRGGVPRKSDVTPAIDLIDPLIVQVRSIIGRNTLPVLLIGHSAGAQFLERVAAYTKANVAAYMIMNPSTYVVPSVTRPVPYGFATIPDGRAQLQNYLGKPITLLLGEKDVTSAHSLVMTPEAMEQGRNRRERGVNTFRMAQDAAASLHSPMGWTLRIVRDVGHDGQKMLASPELREAVETIISRASSQ